MMIRALCIAVLTFAPAAAFADGAVTPAVPSPAGPAKPIVKKIFSGTQTALGQDIALPQGNAEVTVLTYEIPPGARLPVHKHPYPRYAYVLAGHLKVSTGDDTKSFSYGPGDFIIEILDAWHYGETVGSETVKLLVIDQAPPGESNTLLKQ
ncbi:cupin domain-containing protein [Terrihabitans soli]|nr:cupin domain-containing protein [Terrihabitans soli]